MAEEARVATAPIGRERELEELDAFLDAAPKAPRALLLKGEPGIGKTTLWRAAVEAARERGFRVLTARPAEAEASLSFAALGDLLADTTDTIGALPEPQRRALRVALLLEKQEGGVATDSRTLSVALLVLLHRLAEDTAVLVAVDDVQWLDPPTAGALTFALRRLSSEPVSFLGAARPEPVGLAAEGMHVASVGPLAPSAIDAIVRRTLDARPPRPVLRRLGHASGGNPFYALELARGFLHEEGQLEATDPLPLPPSLGDLLRTRLTALPRSSRRALSAVAALSQPTPELVERAVGDDARGLQAARDAGIVDVEDGVVRFTHPLLASAVYADVDPQRRRELHRQLAAVVADREERARHLAVAVEPPDADVALALEEAAEGAFERGATENAAELMEDAVRFTPASFVDALQRRRLTAAGYLARTGAKDRAREVFGKARSVARAGPRTRANRTDRHVVRALEWPLSHRVAPRRRRGRARRPAAARQGSQCPRGSAPLLRLPRRCRRRAPRGDGARASRGDRRRRPPRPRAVLRRPHGVRRGAWNRHGACRPRSRSRGRRRKPLWKPRGRPGPSRRCPYSGRRARSCEAGLGCKGRRRAKTRRHWRRIDAVRAREGRDRRRQLAARSGLRRGVGRSCARSRGRSHTGIRAPPAHGARCSAWRGTARARARRRGTSAGRRRGDAANARRPYEPARAPGAGPRRCGGRCFAAGEGRTLRGRSRLRRSRRSLLRPRSGRSSHRHRRAREGRSRDCGLRVEGRAAGAQAGVGDGCTLSWPSGRRAW